MTIASPYKHWLNELKHKMNVEAAVVAQQSKVDALGSAVVPPGAAVLMELVLVVVVMMVVVVQLEASIQTQIACLAMAAAEELVKQQEKRMDLLMN
jgi:hypothetical protein